MDSIEHLIAWLNYLDENSGDKSLNKFSIYKKMALDGFDPREELMLIIAYETATIMFQRLRFENTYVLIKDAKNITILENKIDSSHYKKLDDLRYFKTLWDGYRNYDPERPPSMRLYMHEKSQHHNLDLYKHFIDAVGKRKEFDFYGINYLKPCSYLDSKNDIQYGILCGINVPWALDSNISKDFVFDTNSEDKMNDFKKSAEEYEKKYGWANELRKKNPNAKINSHSDGSVSVDNDPRDVDNAFKEIRENAKSKGYAC